MSKANAAEVEADVVCGWCGIAEVDNIKLEDCDGCDLVKVIGMLGIVRDGQKNYMTENYLRSLISAITESARFAFCRCRLMQVNLL